MHNFYIQKGEKFSEINIQVDLSNPLISDLIVVNFMAIGNRFFNSNQTILISDDFI
jgi:hypothetical protein